MRCARQDYPNSRHADIPFVIGNKSALSNLNISPTKMYRTPIAYICYVSKILTVGSEPVISFFNKGKLISLGLPFLHFCKK